jgi:NAD(P)-dependent dehydrogenase (short-subunit alcohol dehydrogenase family)
MCFFQQAAIPAIPQDLDLTNQTIIVTGATRGTGFETSLQLLRNRASNLILAVRNPDNGIAARAKLLKDPEVSRVNANAVVEVFKLDLADFKSVVAFADQIMHKVKRLDVLLLNAGINLARFEKTKDGHEMSVNNLFNCAMGVQWSRKNGKL